MSSDYDVRFQDMLCSEFFSNERMAKCSIPPNMRIKIEKFFNGEVGGFGRKSKRKEFIDLKLSEFLSIENPGSKLMTISGIGKGTLRAMSRVLVSEGLPPIPTKDDIDKALNAISSAATEKPSPIHFDTKHDTITITLEDCPGFAQVVEPCGVTGGVSLIIWRAYKPRAPGKPGRIGRVVAVQFNNATAVIERIRELMSAK